MNKPTAVLLIGKQACISLGVYEKYYHFQWDDSLV